MILLEAARLHVNLHRKENFLRCQERTYELIYYTVCSVNTTNMHRAGAGCWTLNCRAAQVLLGSCL